MSIAYVAVCWRKRTNSQWNAWDDWRNRVSFSSCPSGRTCVRALVFEFSSQSSPHSSVDFRAVWVCDTSDILVWFEWKRECIEVLSRLSIKHHVLVHEYLLPSKERREEPPSVSSPDSPRNTAEPRFRVANCWPPDTPSPWSHSGSSSLPWNLPL